MSKKNAHGLKTLGDYRRAAKDSLFGLPVIPESRSTSPFDAIKTALVHSRDLISFSRYETAWPLCWNATHLPETEYELKNLDLFYCIKLMEYAIAYHDVNSIDKLFPNWPKRPDATATVFTSAGISFLEAALAFVCELGSDIMLCLQYAYNKQNREGHIFYRNPFDFLDKTPTVDNLEINPVPDIIIKTWFDRILTGTQKRIPENVYPDLKVWKEFNSTRKQLEYEWDTWKKTSDKTKPGNGSRQKGPLLQFIRNCCDLGQGLPRDLKTRASGYKGALRDKVDAKKTSLPEPVNGKAAYDRGFTHIYWYSDLVTKWPEYLEIIPSLPELKSSITAKSFAKPRKTIPN